MRLLRTISQQARMFPPQLAPREIQQYEEIVIHSLVMAGAGGMNEEGEKRLGIKPDPLMPDPRKSSASTASQHHPES